MGVEVVMPVVWINVGNGVLVVVVKLVLVGVNAEV